MINLLLKNGKALFTKAQSNILSASATMMLLLIITKAIGLFTKTIVVTQLGAGKYGIFVAANAIPEFLSILLIFGSVTSVIVPILVESIHADEKEDFTILFSSLLNFGLITFIIIAILIMLFAGKVTPLVVEKFTNPETSFDAAQMDRITNMMRWLLLPQIILAISGFLSSALNAYKRFIIPQIAPMFYNVGLLIGALFLIPLLGGSVWGLVWGTLIGAILHLIIQVPLGIHLNIKYVPVIKFASKRLRKAALVGLPRIIALVSDQIAIVIDKFIAWGISFASLGTYQLAVSLVTIPYSLFSSTFSVAALPHLSEAFAKNDLDGFKHTFIKVFDQILYLTVPTTMIILVLRLPLVRLLYGIFGREFTWENTLMVSWVVFFLTIGLIPEVLGAYIIRAFYAIQDTVRPLIVGVFVVVGGVVTGILFTNYFSHFNTFSIKDLYWEPSFFLSKETGVAAIGGLALSSSLIYSLAFLFLLLFLSRKVGGLKKLWLNFFRKVFYGIVMAVLMYSLIKMWEGLLDTAQTINLLILTISTIIPGVAIYLWLSYMFKDPEIKMVEKILKIFKRILLARR